MCFSAAASFAGGAVLTVIGVATIHENKEPSQRLFAAIPFVFGLQQLSEGVVWLALRAPGHDPVLRIATTVFLIAAVIIWPTLVPLSMLLMEKTRQRRRILYALLAVGVAVSLAHLIGMIIYDVTAQISGLHILYAMTSPPPVGRLTTFAYIVATIPPIFISSKKRMLWFGITVVLALAATQIFYTEFLVSIWCFFAALASVLIWWILRQPRTGAVSLRGRIVRRFVSFTVWLAGGNIIAFAKKHSNNIHHGNWRPPKGFRLEQVNLPNDIYGEYLVPEAAPAAPGQEGTLAADQFAILYLHGGGYTLPYFPASRRNLIKLAGISGVPALAVDYRVAPEHCYPAALDDAVAALEWLGQVKGFPAGHVIAAGDSAGGGLALALAMRLRDEGREQLRALVLLSPWTDLTMQADSYTSRFKQDPVFGHRRTKPGDGDISAAGRVYAGGHDLKEPYISPACGDFRSLPPMLIHVGECEILHDDSVAITKKAQAAGVAVQFKCWPGMFHVFQMADGLIPEASASWREIESFLKQHFEEPG